MQIIDFPQLFMCLTQDFSINPHIIVVLIVVVVAWAEEAEGRSWKDILCQHPLPKSGAVRRNWKDYITQMAFGERAVACSLTLILLG